VRVNRDVEAFLVDLELADRKPRYVKDYEWKLGQLFSFLKKNSAKNVTVMDMRCFLNSYKRTHAHNTYFLAIWRFRKFFKERNSKVYGFLKELKIALKKRNIRPFTPKEALAIANHFKKYRGSGAHVEKLYYTVSFFLFFTGARIGEVCGLNVGDLKDDGHCTQIFFRTEITKTGESREVPLHNDSVAYKALIDYLRSRKSLKPNDPLFVNSGGRRLRPATVQRKYRNARQALGINKKCTPHVNRHSFVNYLREHKEDVATIAELTGHSVATLLKDYSFVTKKSKKEAVKKIKLS